MDGDGVGVRIAGDSSGAREAAASVVHSSSDVAKGPAAGARIGAGYALGTAEAGARDGAGLAGARDGHAAGYALVLDWA